MTNSRRLGTTLAAFFTLAGHTTAEETPVSFNLEVRPILSAHCFACHGPDAEERRGDLRLDAPGADDRSRLLPDNDGPSLVLERILHGDPNEVMPPPGAKNPLSPEQKDVLKRWIDQGAPYEAHWAFEAPTLSPPPNAHQWPNARHPVDAFVFEKLDDLEIEPAPPADRHTLARRWSLDLLGFPPLPEEADTFVKDDRLNAEERFIDRLLGSPAYGERWARQWMDLARYADTNGYEKDRPRSIWPYRDWLIDALNADQPFDDFTIDQLAGDMRPRATLPQRIATGFHRNTMLNEEGGIDPLEYRFHSLVDRVGTTATVWMGLTMACAQCHTHKYDPLTHRDYYGMMAFLNNAEEPDLYLPKPEIDAKRTQINERLAQLRAELPKHFPQGQSYVESLEAWHESTAHGMVTWEILRPEKVEANLGRLEILDDQSVLAAGDQTKRDIYQVHIKGDWEGVTALRLEALPHPSLPKSGPGRAYYEGPKGDFFLSEITLQVNGNPAEWSTATENYGKLGIGGGSGKAAEAMDGNEVTGWSTSGREGEAHQAVFQLAEPLNGSGNLLVEMVFNRHYPASLGRFRIAITREQPGKARAQTFAQSDESLFLKRFDTLNSTERARLETLFCQVAPELAEARKALESERGGLPDYPTTLVFTERPPGYERTTFRHHRGEFLQPKEAISPAIPSILDSLTEAPPANRMEFAQWLVGSGNPLAARVQVNRDWAAFFGNGLVPTLEDFGTQGKPPTHPRLLDWLAIDFSNTGSWSRKRLHRLVVTSAIYQQSSHVTPEALSADPENVWLGRAPRFRIDGEFVRDSALRAAGLLTSKMRGPSVFPPQPKNITTEGTYGRLNWNVSEGEDRYRRSLYTFAKRTAPYALFTTFDAGSGEACLARREVTNTPLQALTALNDTSLLEAAQALGSDAARHRDLPADRTAQHLFRRILTRSPDAEEKDWLLAYFTQQKERFASRPEQAKELIGTPADAAETAAQAAWTALARVLLNLDETYLHH